LIAQEKYASRIMQMRLSRHSEEKRILIRGIEFKKPDMMTRLICDNSTQ